jgi:hypothetical protein
MLSKSQRIIGLICLGVSSLFAAELVYEQTLLTQSDGPQMIGFTLAHEYVGFLLFGFTGEMGLYIWGGIFLIALGYLRIKRGRTASVTEWLQFAASVFVLLLFWIPYDWWQIASVKLDGPGPRAADQLTIAASLGDRHLVDALLRGGVNVDSVDRNKRTALGSACNHLISLGANLDRAEECRRYWDFAAKMKPEQASPDDGFPKVPGQTVVVTTSPYN